MRYPLDTGNAVVLPVTGMENYGKHFASMYTGSMVGAGPVVFAVWGYVVANQSPRDIRDLESDIVVELNAQLLSFILGAKEEEVEKAINFLCSPDPRSRTLDEGGRRLVREGQFLYRVVNGRSYRWKRNHERERERLAQKQKRYRERLREGKLHKSGKELPGEREFIRAELAGDTERADQIAAGAAGKGNGAPPATEASASEASLPSKGGVLGEQTVVKAMAESVEKRKSGRAAGVNQRPSEDDAVAYAVKIGLPIPEVQKFFNHFDSNGWKVGVAKTPMVSWQAAMRTWRTNWEERRYEQAGRNGGGSTGGTDYRGHRAATAADHAKGF